jgi:hypothetical protein
MADRAIFEMPSVVTHIYDPARGPFRNICDLPIALAEAVLEQIRQSGRRTIKTSYLSRRLATEDWLATKREELLGPMPLRRPIYFFLGDFADGKDAARPESILMPLAAFSPSVLTFTYGDSMTSHSVGTRPEFAEDRKAYHGRVFTLDEMVALVGQFGMPGNRWKTDHTMKYDQFIEVQVWDDLPIRRQLAALGFP